MWSALNYTKTYLSSLFSDQGGISSNNSILAQNTSFGDPNESYGVNDAYNWR